MRIHDQNPARPGPAGGTGPAASRGPAEGRPVSGVGGGSAGVRATESAASGPDRVSLSNLAASLSPAGESREAELDRLAELYQRGIYNADAGVVADRLIEEGLMNPPETPEGGGGV